LFLIIQRTTTFFVVNNLKINNVYIDNNSIPVGIVADVLLGELKLELPKADLTKNEVEMELFSLKDADIFL
jgi:translocation and assembly module TamB